MTPEALTGGSWEPGPAGVFRWAPGAPPPVARTPVHQLIACPTCHARVDQTCRSTGGNPVLPHKSRLTLRLCSCGARVAWKKQRCELCAIEARRETYRLREARQPTRTRRRKAA